MQYSPILLPVAVLIAWSLIVMLWMVVSRMGTFRKLGVNLSTLPAGARGSDLDGRADPHDQWKAHNYNHLMEQPTIFYAIALTLALLDSGGGTNLWLAWAYVGFRVLHSIVQATVNVVLYRFSLFFLASLCLVGLTVNALRDLL